MKHFRKSKPGIALFILMTALVVLSLVIRELITSASNQATRVRNSGDRIQALYLAKSSLSLARFILALDRTIDKQLAQAGQKPSDRLDDIWAQANPFPPSLDAIRALQKAGQENKDEPAENQDEQQDPAFYQKCQEFFDDFPGDTLSTTSDLSSKIPLNDLSPTSSKMIEVLTELLRPSVEFIRHLNEINTTPESLAREIWDYADSDDKEESTNADESYAYSALQLDYGPKNRLYSNLDELKLVPHVDEAVFQYLADFVNPYTPTQGTAPKINLNTVSKEVFQSMLMGVPDAAIVAEHFIKDRAENKRTYTTDSLEKTLSDAVQINGEQIRIGLLTGQSNAFKIESIAHVNKIELKLETIVARKEGITGVEPVLIMRVSP